MKRIDVTAWITTIILYLIIILFYSHRYPYHSEKDYVKDLYFDMYTMSQSKEKLTHDLKKELKKGASIENDCDIVEWMLNNDVCDKNILDVLDEKIKSYEQNEYDILKKDPDHYYENVSELNTLNIKALKFLTGKLHEKCNEL